MPATDLKSCFAKVKSLAVVGPVISQSTEILSATTINTPVR